jgi:hypothetical protein
MIGTISLLVGVFLMQDSLNHTNLPNHVKTNCSLDKGEVIMLPDGCGYTTVWKTTKGQTAIDNPFTSTHSRTVALSRLIDYPLNTGLECYCPKNNAPNYPNIAGFVDCNIWNTCVLEHRMAEHIQDVGLQYLYLSEVLIAFSGLSVLLSIVLSFVSCCCGSAIQQCFDDCSCCKKSNSRRFERV